MLKMNKNPKGLYTVKKYRILVSSLIEHVTYVSTRTPKFSAYLTGLLLESSRSWSRPPNWNTKIIVYSILRAHLAIGKVAMPHVLCFRSSRSVRRTFLCTRWTGHPGAVPTHSLLKKTRNMDMVRNAKIFSASIYWYFMIYSWHSSGLLSFYHACHMTRDYSVIELGRI